ncbi:MAG: transcription termination factor Rho, partial [Proteobacteria bacterium]|nr:transcription termination factor Rho [Pseudomonadota bacterium]
ELGPGARGGHAVKNVITISGLPPAEAAGLPKFNNLTSVSPTERLRMETSGGPVTMRLVDLVTPLGRGARGLIVAPPRTGKTTILKQMAQAMTTNQPDLKVIALLVDERPEEVTDMRRSIDGLVVASSMDQEPANHRRIATLMIAAARRRVEAGEDVFVILDSVTRLARAFNQAQNSGRTMTGGLDAKAMEVPRQIFGSARETEEGGSLTIVATALVDTGSRMDELIFQEFKGTGNMELSLSREMADRRVWPAINIAESGTRKEELLFDELERATVPLIRRALLKLRPEQATEKMAQTLAKHPDNKSFLTLVKEGEF